MDEVEILNLLLESSWENYTACVRPYLRRMNTLDQHIMLPNLGNSGLNEKLYSYQWSYVITGQNLTGHQI